MTARTPAFRKVAADAAALQKEKSRLSRLSETIVARREALAKAQKELKESLQEAQRAEESVAALLRAHADSQQAIISKSLEKAAAAAAGGNGGRAAADRKSDHAAGKWRKRPGVAGRGARAGLALYAAALRADQPPPPAGPAGAGARAAVVHGALSSEIEVAKRSRDSQAGCLLSVLVARAFS